MTEATVAAKTAQKVIYDKLQAQIHTLEAQVSTLKAKAESAKADAEIKAIANLASAKRALDDKVAELKNAGETKFQQVKADVDVRVAEFEKSVKAIAAKFNAR